MSKQTIEMASTAALAMNRARWAGKTAAQRSAVARRMLKIRYATPPSSTEPLLSLESAGKQFRVSAWTLRQAAISGELPSVRHRDKYWLAPREVAKFIRARTAIERAKRAARSR